jgi:hypothetical protein
MPAVHRQGDANAGGGVVQQVPQTFVRVTGRLVVVVGSRGSAHPPCPDTPAHCAGVWATAGGSGSVRIGGRAVIRAQDLDTCGHPRVGGAPDVRVGG